MGFMLIIPQGTIIGEYSLLPTLKEIKTTRD